MKKKELNLQLKKNSHWLLVAFFTIVWLSGDDWMQMHIFAGYSILVLSIMFILKRLISGQLFKYARPSLTFKWLKSNLTLFILIFLMLAGISGLLADSSGNDFLEDFHELLANVSLLTVSTHIFLNVLHRLKTKTLTNKPILLRGYDYMNHSTFKKHYHQLLTKWQKITLIWKQSSGKNLLLRSAVISLSLAYTIILTSIFLALVPIILVAAALMTLLFKADISTQNKPIIIDTPPLSN